MSRESVGYGQRLKSKDPYLAGAFAFLAGPLGFLYFSWRASVAGFAVTFIATALFLYSGGHRTDAGDVFEQAFARNSLWSAEIYLVCAIYAYEEVRRRNKRTKQITDFMHQGISSEEAVLQARLTYKQPNRREQLNTSFAAGLGAAGGLMAYFALFGIYGKGGIVKGVSELSEFLAVTGVVLWLTLKYIDPYREFFAAKGSVGQERRADPLRFLSTKERWVIASVTVSLAIFVELYRHGLATTGAPGFIIWAILVLVACVTTYYWIEGVAIYPPRAHTKGAASGAAVAGSVVVFVLLAFIFLAHLRHLSFNEQIYSPRSALRRGMFAAADMALYGYAGGMALNHLGRLHPGLKAGVGLAAAGIAAYLLTLPLGLLHSAFSPASEFPFILAGWVAGLLIYPPSATLLRARHPDVPKGTDTAEQQNRIVVNGALLRSHLKLLTRSVAVVVLGFIVVNGSLLIGQRMWHRHDIEIFKQFNRIVTERGRELTTMKASLDAVSAQGEEKYHSLQALNAGIKRLEAEYAGSSSWPTAISGRYRSLLAQRNEVQSEMIALADRYEAGMDRYNAKLDAYNQDVLRAQNLAKRAFSRWFFLPYPFLLGIWPR